MCIGDFLYDILQKCKTSHQESDACVQDGSYDAICSIQLLSYSMMHVLLVWTQYISSLTGLNLSVICGG